MPKKIVYTTSLLRKDVETWITPYIEDLEHPSRETQLQFVEELKSQFDIINRKEEGRHRLQNIIQGKRIMTQYWNEFRLVFSEAELNKATEGEWSLARMMTILQNAWGTYSNISENVDTLARWSMEKETKLMIIKHIQHGQAVDHKATTTP